MQNSGKKHYYDILKEYGLESEFERECIKRTVKINDIQDCSEVISMVIQRKLGELYKTKRELQETECTRVNLMSVSNIQLKKCFYARLKKQCLPSCETNEKVNEIERIISELEVAKELAENARKRDYYDSYFEVNT